MTIPGRILATRELGMVQDEAARALSQSADDRAHPLGEPTEVQFATCGARFGELLRVDSSRAAMRVQLPAATSDRVGEAIVVKNDSASTNAIVVVAQPLETIDGMTLDTIAAGWYARTYVVLARGRWGAI